MAESPPALAVPAAALAELAAALAGMSFAALGAAAQQSARQRLYDTVSATALGLTTPEGRLLLDHAHRSAPDSREWSIGRCCRLYVGATRSTESDDIDIESCTTVGSVVVPVALCLAAAHRAGARDLLVAVAAGYEAMMRLGRAIDGAFLLYRGVWPTYVTAAFGAAATAARLLRMDEAATAHALALALTRSASVPAAALAQHGLRYWALGAAAADGIDAAVAAAAGVAADLGAVASYAERLGVPVDPAVLTRACGSPWLVSAVDTKPWPTARQALASVAAFRQQAPHADIEHVTVCVPAAYRGMIDRSAMPTTRIEAMLGVQYQLALARFAPERLDDVRRATLADASLVDFMRKIEVRADDELSARFPRSWGSRVIVRHESGAEVTSEVLDPDGSSRRPFGWAELEQKVARIRAGSGLDGGEWPSRLRTLCEGLGAEDDGGVADLVALLTVARERASSRRSSTGAGGRNP